MGKNKTELLEIYKEKAKADLAKLSKEFADPNTEDREGVHAGIDYNKWYIRACEEVQETKKMLS